MLKLHSHERYYSFALSCMRRYCAKCEMVVGIILFLVFRLCECAASPVCSEVFVAASSWFYFRLPKYLREQLSISILIVCSLRRYPAPLLLLFLAASLRFSLFLVFVVTVDGFGFRFVKSGYVVVYLRLFGPDLLNVRPCFSLFGSSVTYINRGHFHNRRNY